MIITNQKPITLRKTNGHVASRSRVTFTQAFIRLVDMLAGTRPDQESLQSSRELSQYIRNHGAHLLLLLRK